MALPQAINFRATAGFVTDVSPEYANLITPAYPDPSPQGNNVGFEDTSTQFSVDRNSGADRRFAGNIYNPNGGGTIRFRIDLPTTGSKVVRAAFGDYSSAQHTKAELFDNTTSLVVMCDATTSGARTWFDATGVELTDSTWPGSNAAQTKTFASTILRVKLGAATGGSGNSSISHLYVDDAVAAPSKTPYQPWYQMAPILAQ